MKMNLVQVKIFLTKKKKNNSKIFVLNLYFQFGFIFILRELHSILEIWISLQLKSFESGENCQLILNMA